MREVTAELVVVGAGPAGLAAAAAARVRGVDVVLLDENARPGGQIWRQGRGVRLDARCAALLEVLAGARVEAGLAVHDARAGDGVELRATDGAGAVVRVRAAAVVIATGSTERFLPFPGWTLPGVVGVGGLQALAKQGLDLRGARVALAGSGPLHLAVAASLRERGAELALLVEQAPRARLAGLALALARSPRKLAQAAALTRALRGVPRRAGAWVTRASRAAEGGLALEVSRGPGLTVDWLATGFGLVPETRLAELLGCRIEAGAVVVNDDQRTSAASVLAAGEPTGIGGVDVALAEGALAGLAASDADEAARRPLRARVRRERRFARALERAFALRPELRDLPDDDTCVCRCEDVAWGRVRGWADARQAKLETRCGMGACQGRVCGPALEVLRGWTRDRARPPLVPVSFQALAEGASDSAPDTWPTRPRGIPT